METYIDIDCCLNTDTGTVDYNLHLNPSFAFDPSNPDLDFGTTTPPSSPPLNPTFLPMNILAWNIRGTANSDFRREFRNLQLKYSPDIVILTQTRLDGRRAHAILSTLGYDNFVKIDAMGFSGGIWVLWHPHIVTIEPLASSFQEIHCKVKVNNSLFILSAIYGSPNYDIRKNLWKNLSLAFKDFNLPWHIMGDFNDIASSKEKFGGRPPNIGKMISFNNFLNSCTLIDLGFSGPLFTWTNNRDHGKTDRTRIDRCHANSLWLQLFPNSFVSHLPRTHSDHYPILLNILHYSKPPQNFFRLDSFWLNHPTFLDLIKSYWKNELPNIDENITTLQKEIKNWSNHHFKNIFYEKKKLYSRILGLQNILCSNPLPQHLILEKNLQQKFFSISKQEEELWQMKARINSITLGDKNTKFFHQTTIIRRKNNKLLTITKDDGSISWDQNEITNTIFNHFNNIYSYSSTTSYIVFSLNHLPGLTDLQKSSLKALPSDLEIKMACFDLHPFKSPGEDGLHAIFYQKNWSSVKDQIISIIKNIFTSPFFLGQNYPLPYS